MKKKTILILQVEDVIEDVTQQKEALEDSALWEAQYEPATWLDRFEVQVENAIEIGTWDVQNGPFPKEQALRQILESGCYAVLLDLALTAKEEGIAESSIDEADEEEIHRIWNSDEIEEISGLWILKQLHDRWRKGESVPLVAISTARNRMSDSKGPWYKWLMSHGTAWCYSKPLDRTAAETFLNAVMFNVAANSNWAHGPACRALMDGLRGEGPEGALWDTAQTALFELLDRLENENDAPVAAWAKRLGMSLNTYKSWRERLEQQPGQTAPETELAVETHPMTATKAGGEREVLVLQVEDDVADADWHDRLINDQDIWHIHCGPATWLLDCRFRFENAIEIGAWDHENGPFPKERALMRIINSGCRAVLLDLALTAREEALFRQDYLWEMDEQAIEGFWNGPDLEKLSGLWLLRELHGLWKRGLPVPIVAIATSIESFKYSEGVRASRWNPFLLAHGTTWIFGKPLTTKPARWFPRVMVVAAASTPAPFFPELTGVLWKAAQAGADRPSLWEDGRMALFRFLERTAAGEQNAVTTRAQRLGMAVNTYKRWREQSDSLPVDQ